MIITFTGLDNIIMLSTRHPVLLYLAYSSYYDIYVKSIIMDIFAIIGQLKLRWGKLMNICDTLIPRVRRRHCDVYTQVKNTLMYIR